MKSSALVTFISALLLAALPARSPAVSPTAFAFGGSAPWHENIVTTVFWVGEPPTLRNVVPNRASAWERNWEALYGGFDDPNPARRRGFRPAAFTPGENPFYCALPYNDVTHGHTKPEARKVIPWFSNDFRREGESVCHNRWVEIKNARTGKICYAQWSDCGPFRTDHWQYVFGRERPKPNLNNAAGLDVSPAVQQYLGLGSIDVTSWKFVDFNSVPRGPWAQLGYNNPFVDAGKRPLAAASQVAEETNWDSSVNAGSPSTAENKPKTKHAHTGQARKKKHKQEVAGTKHTHGKAGRHEGKHASPHHGN